MKMHKNMSNNELAELLRSVAAAYQIKNQAKNRFRIIAYQRAADAVEHLSSDAKDIWDEGKLEQVSGIGSSIAEHLNEIFKTGKSKHFESVLNEFPPAVYELMKVPGIGPSKAYRLTTEFDLPSDPYEKLVEVAQKGKITELEGFGEESQRDIIQAIKEYQAKPEARMLISHALANAEPILEWIRSHEAVKAVDVLGSLRRRAATVGDLDFAAATNSPKEVLKHFTDFPNKSRVIEIGDRTASILLPNGLQVDLMVEKPSAYGSLLQHFTGSKHHNIALRNIALKKGWSLSDYGIKIKNKLETFSTEEALYKKMGMDYIPPELREGTDELKLAQSKALPNLVELSDVRGDLQIHSDFNIETSHDVGDSSMEEIVKKADGLGYEYLAFTEHNPSQKGHEAKDFMRLLDAKKSKILTLNESMKTLVKRNFKYIFNSLEIDILPNGKLPVPDQALELLDFALVSIHSSFKQSKKDMTKRVITALENPKAKIFAHPTARKLNEREGVELDWDQIFDFCLKNNKLIEINAEPSRLDLPDFLVREGKKYGVRFTLGTDSHHVDALENMKYGVFVARRGWLEKADIVNTLPLNDFKKVLQ